MATGIKVLTELVKRTIKITVILLCLLLTACAGWPPSGQGGMAEHIPRSLRTVEADNRLGPEHGLRFDLELTARHLDMLVLEGAELCFPATVVQSKERENRIRRELDGKLDYAAANDILIQRQVLTRLERQLDYVTAHDVCVLPNHGERYAHPYPSYPETKDYVNSQLDRTSRNTQKTKNNTTSRAVENNDISAKHETNKKLIKPGDIALYIANELNADNQFAHDSAALNPKYIARLAKASIQLNEQKHLDLHIVGYADDTGDNKHNESLSQQRAQKVARYLQILGLKPHRMKVTWLGESMPLFEGREDEIRLVNRRVSIEVLENTKVQAVSE